MATVLLPLVIHVAKTEEQRNKALAFIKEVAWRSHKSAPPPPPQILLVASEGEVIQGTMSLDFGDNGPLPLETIWTFNQAETPFPFIRSKLVQFGRWMAVSSGLSLTLVYAAACFSRAHGKECIVCEVKPPVFNRLAHSGIHLSPLRNAQLVLERIPQEGRPYYTTKPLPYPYMVGVQSVIDACLKRDPTLRSLEFAHVL